MDNYTLLPDHTVKQASLMEWATWFEEKNNRIVQQDRNEQYFVSTCFLGIDHSYGEGPPQLFETMVFAQKDGKTDYSDLEFERYATWDEALEGHKKMCEQYRVTLDQPTQTTRIKTTKRHLKITGNGKIPQELVDVVKDYLTK